MLQSMLCIPLGYFLGSVNAASIIAWIIGRVDMRDVPDGRISASEVHHKLGLVPFFLADPVRRTFGHVRRAGSQLPQPGKPEHRDVSRVSRFSRTQLVYVPET